ncbi:MAG: hypothetical protein Q9168_003043 [Polycauliona sp. 1 TL-2023]
MPGKEAKQEKPKKEEPENKSEVKVSSAVPSKRKAKSDDAPARAPRRSARGAVKPQPDPVALINYLLSPGSLDSCRPKDEIEDAKTRSSLRTYSSSTFSPFEELMCAVILSRPISHALGLRSIRTLLNEPYNLTSPKKIRAGGFESVIKAVNEARTQHRQKTATELVMLADAVVDHLGDDDENEREMIRKNVKGLGKTGLDIFGRRIQAQWPELYPFADQRTLAGLEKIGLPGTAEELKELLDHHWAELNVQDLEGSEDDKKRRVFVRLLERAIGSDLEGNTDRVRAEATKRVKND